MNDRWKIFVILLFKITMYIYKYIYISRNVAIPNIYVNQVWWNKDLLLLKTKAYDRFHWLVLGFLFGEFAELFVQAFFDVKLPFQLLRQFQFLVTLQTKKFPHNWNQSAILVNSIAILLIAVKSLKKEILLRTTHFRRAHEVNPSRNFSCALEVIWIIKENMKAILILWIWVFLITIKSLK